MRRPGQIILMSVINMDETLLRQIVREEIKVLLPLTEKLLTVQEVAAYLSYSTHTIYRLTSQNRIPFHKKSGALYFRESELLEFITKGNRSHE